MSSGKVVIPPFEEFVRWLSSLPADHPMVARNSCHCPLAQWGNVLIGGSPRATCRGLHDSSHIPNAAGKRIADWPDDRFVRFMTMVDNPPDNMQSSISVARAIVCARLVMERV